MTQETVVDISTNEYQFNLRKEKFMSYEDEVETIEKAPAAAEQNWSLSENNEHEDDNKLTDISNKPQVVPSAPPPEDQPPKQSCSLTNEPPKKLGATGKKPKRQFPEELEVWSTSVDINDLASEMAQLFSRHCVLTKEEIDAIVLWLLSSYVFDDFRIFPRLALISPEKRCGKTTTMEVIGAMCRDGVITANMSAAIIYRLTGSCSPTLLVDEADTFIKNGDPNLIGMLNSGHTKSSAFVMRCDGDDYTPKAHSTWMPMVLASIGELPSTMMDRSIVINLRRKKATEQVDRLPSNVLESLLHIRRRILSWCQDHEDLIHQNVTEPPLMGNDRAVDNWVPLYSVANQMNEEWRDRCDRAYKALTAMAEPELATELLRTIKDYFRQSSDDKVPSAVILSYLLQDTDGAWSDIGSGKRVTSHHVAKLLQPYGIKPKGIRFGEKTLRGYEKQQFMDAFARYL